MAAVTICSDFGAQKNKVWRCFHCFPSISHEVMRPDTMIFIFWMLSFKPTFSLSTFTFIKRLLSSSSLSAIRVVSSAYLRLLIYIYMYIIAVSLLNHIWLFCNPMDYSPPSSSVYGIFQARIMDWVAISFSRDFPDLGIEPTSPELQAYSVPLSH